MLKKIMLATVTSVFLLLSVAVHAEPVTMVFSCKLKDGSTKDDAMAINARWLKWARATGVDADSGFDAEFDAISTCSSNRMLRGEETVPAK
jgi:hypothetical protein